MQELFKNSSQGQERLKRQIDREHESYSRVLQAEEQAQKKQTLHTSGSRRMSNGAARKDHRNNPKKAKREAGK